MFFSSWVKRNLVNGLVTTAGILSNTPIGNNVWTALANVRKYYRDL